MPRGFADVRTSLEESEQLGPVLARSCLISTAWCLDMQYSTSLSCTQDGKKNDQNVKKQCDIMDTTHHWIRPLQASVFKFADHFTCLIGPMTRQDQLTSFRSEVFIHFHDLFCTRLTRARKKACSLWNSGKIYVRKHSSMLLRIFFYDQHRKGKVSALETGRWSEGTKHRRLTVSVITVARYASARRAPSFSRGFRSVAYLCKGRHNSRGHAPWSEAPAHKASADYLAVDDSYTYFAQMSVIKASRFMNMAFFLPEPSARIKPAAIVLGFDNRSSQNSPNWALA